MSRVQTTNNLDDNSRYDLLIYDFPEGYPAGQLHLGFGESPKKITGVEKVSQVVFKTLMTNKKSDVLYPDYGTAFSSLTGHYNLGSDDIRDVLREAVTNAEKQAKAILNSNSEGATSRLRELKILGVKTEGDRMYIHLQILTEAGERAPIALPFTSLGIEVNK